MEVKDFCPDKWIKRWVHIYNEILIKAIKKNGIIPFVATLMQLEIIILHKLKEKNTL